MPFFSPSSWSSAERKPTGSIPQCGKCGLYKECLSPRMEPTGKGKRKILFVAEAPGATEDRQGEQLVGDAGQLLREILFELDIDLDDCWKTNAVICRPPGNKIHNKYIESCRPNVFKAISRLQPNVIVLLGNSAVSSIISPEWKGKTGAASRWRGESIPSPLANAWLCPTYHPSYLLRTNKNELLMKETKEHLRKAVDLIDTPVDYLDFEQTKSQIEIILDSRQARTRIRDLLQKDGLLAFDYETTGLKPELDEQQIVTCSFCYEGEDTFACSVEDSRTLSLVSKLLRSERLAKVASNLKFEERWTLCKLRHSVSRWHWDTMLAAHLLDNKSGITSLKFQSYVQFGIGDYDSHISSYLKSKGSNGLNRIRELDRRDLLLYNGLDSLLEYKLMERQKELLGW